MHDRGRGRVATGGFIAMVAVAFALMELWPLSLAAIIVGVLLLDTACRARKAMRCESGSRLFNRFQD